MSAGDWAWAVGYATLAIVIGTTMIRDASAWWRWLWRMRAGGPPGVYRRPQTALRALAWDSLALGDVPEDQRTYAMCYDTVRRWGTALTWVPEPMRDVAICWLPPHLRWQMPRWPSVWRQLAHRLACRLIRAISA